MKERLGENELRLQKPRRQLNVRNAVAEKTGRLSGSLVKQVRMPAGTLEAHCIAIDAIDQQPVRFDVQIPEALPVAFQGVIEIRLGEGKLFDKKPDRLLELFHILPAPLGQFYVPLELTGIGRSTH